jgi:hypothetical protein
MNACRSFVCGRDGLTRRRLRVRRCWYTLPSATCCLLSAVNYLLSAVCCLLSVCATGWPLSLRCPPRGKDIVFKQSAALSIGMNKSPCHFHTQVQFQMFDEDGNGKISRKELVHAFTMQGVNFSSLTPAAVCCLLSCCLPSPV